MLLPAYSLLTLPSPCPLKIETNGSPLPSASLFQDISLPALCIFILVSHHFAVTSQHSLHFQLELTIYCFLETTDSPNL